MRLEAIGIRAAVRPSSPPTTVDTEDVKPESAMPPGQAFHSGIRGIKRVSTTTSTSNLWSPNGRRSRRCRTPSTNQAFHSLPPHFHGIRHNTIRKPDRLLKLFLACRCRSSFGLVEDDMSCWFSRHSLMQGPGACILHNIARRSGHDGFRLRDGTIPPAAVIDDVLLTAICPTGPTGRLWVVYITVAVGWDD